MARPLRVEFAGAWYHVTARGNERRAIFRSERDRERFLELLAEGATRFALRWHGYVLMPNHYHLIVETPQSNLCRAMQWLNVSYTVWFNRRHRRSGHLFQGRFKAILLDWEDRGVELSRYVHLNPVRTARFGLSKRAQAERRHGLAAPDRRAVILARRTELRQFRWSSYRAYIGFAKAPPWLCVGELRGLLGGPRSTAAQSYRRYVEEAISDGPMESPFEQVEAQLVLGGAALLSRAREALGRNRRREQPGARALRRRAFGDAIAAVSELKSESWESFRDRHGDWGRDLTLWLGRMHCGLKLRELGELAGGLDYATVSVATRRWADRVAKDKKLLKLQLRATQLLNAEM
jgi:putative transposase